MASNSNDSLDAVTKAKYKDLPPIQTSFKDKPLPAIREPPRESGRSTPSSNRTARGYRRLNPKSSLFHLFSRPKVEKQRGWNEPEFAATPISDTDRATPSPELIVREPSPPFIEPQPLYRRPSTSLSVREDPRKLVRSRTPTSEDVAEEVETPVLPTLFDIYSDSSKVTIAQAIDESAASRLTRPRKSNASHIIPAHIHEERRGSVDSIKADKTQGRSGRNSLSQGPFQRKIFALSNDGLILQYSEKGGGERLPERALQLGSDSVAFACDLVPGRPYVLQVDQKPSILNEHHALPSQSLLTKIGLKDSLPRVGEHSMLLILDTAEELTSWMNAVRKQILVLGTGVGAGAKKSPVEQQSVHAPKLRVKHRASIGQQEQPSFTNFSFPKGPGAEGSTNARPRRDSHAAIAPTIQTEPALLQSRRNSNATAARKPLVEHEGKDRLKKMASFDTTGSRDSPLSIATHDSAISFGTDARKRIIRDKNASQKSSIGSLNDEFGTDSPILPRSMTNPNMERPKPKPIVDRPRPDSFVADLPLLWPARKTSESITSAPKEQTTNSPPMKRLPLKVNPSSGAMSVPRQRPTQSPSKPGPPPTRALPSIPSRPVENFSRKPQRSPSVKLSLFPNSDLAAPSSAPPTVKPLPPSPLTPGDDSVRSQDRPLRRPASIQIRASHAPFLSSVRPMTSANRPQLSKAESVPCLRGASTLPRAPQAKKPSSSPLPPLDLGMPIVGLAPPAPPPSLPLPKLPPGAQQKALAV